MLCMHASLLRLNDDALLQYGWSLSLIYVGTAGLQPPCLYFRIAKTAGLQRQINQI